MPARLEPTTPWSGDKHSTTALLDPYKQNTRKLYLSYRGLAKAPCPCAYFAVYTYSRNRGRRRPNIRPSSPTGKLWIIGPAQQTFQCKIEIIFLFISLNMCFGCSKEPSHWDGSFEYPQHISMFWLRNKKIIFSSSLLSGGLMYAC